jgi:hypothetical protein
VGTSWVISWHHGKKNTKKILKKNYHGYFEKQSTPMYMDEWITDVKMKPCNEVSKHLRNV